MSFDCVRGTPVALPERALPESMVEWGVDAHDWRTACVQVADEAGGRVEFRTTRFCPDSGCASFDDLIFDEQTHTVDAGTMVEDGDDVSWCCGPLVMQRGADTLEWEASIGGSGKDGGVERIRIRARHDARAGMNMRPLEVVLRRERLAASTVALVEDYLAPELSRAPAMKAVEVASRAGFAGKPPPLLGDGAAAVMLPAAAFVAGCVDREATTAHFCAGWKTEDGALLCWTRSYDVASGELVDARLISLSHDGDVRR